MCAMIVLPENYTNSPTSEQEEKLWRLREIAEAAPLERGECLDWNGPSRYKDVLPPASYPTLALMDPLSTPPANIHRRRALTPLLSPSGPAHSTTPWVLKLVDPLQVGEANSQVWRCTSKQAGSVSGVEGFPVVVKMFHRAFFPFPPGYITNREAGIWDWWPASILEKEEASS